MAEEEKKVEKELPEKKKSPVGKTGVMAKCAAIENFGKRMQSHVKDLQGEMKKVTERIEAGVAEIQKGVQAQVRENEEAVSKMGKNVKALENEIKSYTRDFYFG